MGFKAFVTAILVVGAASAEGTVKAEQPPDFVPLGAYLSWERTSACAKHFGIDQWDDVNRRLDALHANHFNLLWVTNMSEAHLPRFAIECRKRHIRLLPCVDSVEAKVEWRWAPNTNYYEDVLPRVVKSVADSKSVAGWVLSDEPQEKDFPKLETLRTRLRDLDPNRFSTAVFMWPQAPLTPRQIKFPVVCVDLYPFFGPNDPNGPHTDATSKAFFRGNARSMLDAIGDSPTHGWIMGMCFSDIWGPRKYDDKGHLIALPGAYLHWRAPTLAEMRWQVWETFRSGAKGFICYTLAPEAPDPNSASAASPDVAWKDVLSKTEADLGPNALTNPDGSATPQLEELGRTYVLLAPYAKVIRRWRQQDSPKIEADGDAQVQVFNDPGHRKTYAIILNDDLHEPRTVTLRLNETVASLTDLVHKQEVSLATESAKAGSTARINLDAGEGTILRIKTH